MLTAGILGLGVRRLAGSCEVCGDTVCQVCLGTQVLAAGDFRQRPVVPGQAHRKARGRVCRACWWEHLTERGIKPPFPAPPGQRERAARAERASCQHPGVTQAMGFCPGCGDEVEWKAEHGNPVCVACEAPSHPRFNHCWACGESFDEANTPEPQALGYRLEFDCDAEDCTGKLAWLMPYCPWCGEAKHWEPASGGNLECTECERRLDRAWAHCVRCGEEAPLPDDCPRCGQDLEDAPSATRCESCRNIVCGDCFDTRVVPSDSGERQERLLCATCGVGFEVPAPPSAEDEDDDDAGDEDVSAGDDAEEGDESGADDDSYADDDSDAHDDSDADDDAASDEPPDVEPEPEPRAEAPHAQEPEPVASAWEVLGITPGAPLADARRAYLALVAQYHPDKVAQLGPKLQALAQEETRRIIEAWEYVRRRTS
ncbi:DnaJ domain-containing protein [Corallococcus macrosporus]|uniref:DnaJ domain-containing protein n=1 Tax=Myxococcus fulvus (strain ATCC BAA-855 / HW-1) TaxID=483219 RepID=F8CP45_MYXFH|nr:DnaJ domain-containing protein [Corallococcus macrosporus]